MADRTLVVSAMLILALSPAAMAVTLPGRTVLDAPEAGARQYQQPPSPPAEPSGPGDTSLVTFYGHVFGHTMDAPMPANTEPPTGEENYGIGSFDWCTSAVSEIDCQDADASNKLALFTTAGFVDVVNRAQWSQEGGYALLHNERGSTQDIQLDPSQHVTAGAYVSLDFHSWPVGNGYGTLCAYPHPPDVPCLYPYWGWDPGAQPDFVVEATLYHATLGTHGANASDQPPIRQAWEEGAEIVAQGRWGPDAVVNGLPGSPNVNHFEIDLGTPKITTIPKTDNLFIVYSVYSESSGTQWGLHSARWWSGELFPPTFTLPVKNAFVIERVTPVFAHGRLAILAIMNTPWGSYDVDPASVGLEVQGPQSFVQPEHIAEFADFSVAHGGHYIPINVTWVWDYGSDELAPGEYRVTATAHNFQGSATGVCTASFSLVRDDERVMPGKAQDGLCGEQTISEERLRELREEVEEG